MGSRGLPASGAGGGALPNVSAPEPSPHLMIDLEGKRAQETGPWKEAAETSRGQGPGTRWTSQAGRGWRAAGEEADALTGPGPVSACFPTNDGGNLPPGEG